VPAGESGARSELRSSPARGLAAARLGERPRPASRPAVTRRSAAGGAVKRTKAPRPRQVTGRATVLFAVLIALALGYTYPIRVYLNQQSDIARMEAAQEAQRQRIGELSEQAALWEDPEYIKIQARERFYMVLPGEVPLVVLTDEEGAARENGGAVDTDSAAAVDPWYDTLWSSIVAADEDSGE
jgi:cell division protein FtsB